MSSIHPGEFTALDKVEIDGEEDGIFERDVCRLTQIDYV